MLKDFRKGFEKPFENQNLLAFNIGLSCKSPYNFNSSNANVFNVNSTGNLNNNNVDNTNAAVPAFSLVIENI